jgi:hypothetical protein
MKLCFLPFLYLCFWSFIGSAQTLEFPLKNLMKSDSANPNGILRRDGIYNTYDTTKAPCGLTNNELYVSYSPLLIVNNNCAMYLFFVGAHDNAQLHLKYYYSNKYPIIKYAVGSINMSDVIITATLPIDLYMADMRLKEFQVHFEGTIKNKDTILNWHMIPPYPRAPRQSNHNFKHLIAPKLMYFIESKELLGLDSLYQATLQTSTH